VNLKLLVAVSLIIPTDVSTNIQSTNVADSLPLSRVHGKGH
jgi:hypothetical protein